MIEVDYNRLVHHPAPHIDELVEFVGIGLDRDKICGVVEPGLNRQRG